VVSFKRRLGFSSNLRGIHRAVIPKSHNLGMRSESVPQCFPSPSEYHSNAWSCICCVSVERYMRNHTDTYDGVIVINVRVCRVCKGSHGLDNNGTGMKTVVCRPREAN